LDPAREQKYLQRLGETLKKTQNIHVKNWIFNFLTSKICTAKKQLIFSSSSLATPLQ
jgi:hypothetical protein